MVYRKHRKADVHLGTYTNGKMSMQRIENTPCSKEGNLQAHFTQNVACQYVLYCHT